MTPNLFTPLKLRELTLRNRIMVSPMCQYSAREGVPNDWHMVHLGSRAVGGAGLVMVEATGVSPEGRISRGDTGIYNEEQQHAFSRIVKFLKSQHAAAGIQLAHAGRKASTHIPWENQGSPLTGKDAWQTLGPSPLAFGNYPAPREMSEQDMEMISRQFEDAAKRAERAGFDVVEIHMAHGYLLDTFLSPLSNQRKDKFGGSLENRFRFPLMVAKRVRAVWPSEKPLFVRISASDWVEGGFDLPQSVALAKELASLGVDLVDCSSGGISPDAKIPVGPGYQVPFAEGVKKGAAIQTGAVGMITEFDQAEQILAEGRADLIIMAREFLREPYWPMKAAKHFDYKMEKPPEYLRS
jgi:2,4-dienoyl-CoA reductase-like NADH-dependent reductase (Old Yellow Enzyme family)